MRFDHLNCGMRIACCKNILTRVLKFFYDQKPEYRVSSTTTKVDKTAICD